MDSMAAFKVYRSLHKTGASLFTLQEYEHIVWSCMYDIKPLGHIISVIYYSDSDALSDCGLGASSFLSGNARKGTFSMCSTTEL